MLESSKRYNRHTDSPVFFTYIHKYIAGNNKVSQLGIDYRCHLHYIIICHHFPIVNQSQCRVIQYANHIEYILLNCKPQIKSNSIDIRDPQFKKKNYIRIVQNWDQYSLNHKKFILSQLFGSALTKRNQGKLQFLFAFCVF